MRSPTVIASLLLHVLIAGAAWRAATHPRARKATAIAVVDQKKAKPKEEPKPKPKVVATKPVTPHVEEPTPLKSTAPQSHSDTPKAAPMDSGLQLGNSDGPGIDIGGPVRPKKADEDRAQPAKRQTAVKKRDEEEDCNEVPTKPVPVARPTEIEYTAKARADGVEGKMVLEITVGADGSVASTKVLTGVEPSLDAAAVAAVGTWRFKPAMRCGRPMAGGTYRIAQRFELGD